MNCEQVRRYLAMYLDSELSPETTFEISRHLEECESCRFASEHEGRLERELRKRLLQTNSHDDALWDRAILRAISRAKALPGRGMAAKIAIGLTVAAGLLALAILWNPFASHELDLAAATAEAHAEWVSKPPTEFEVGPSVSEINTFFRSRLTPEFEIESALTHNCTVRGADLCKINSAVVAHIVCETGSSPVSIFWISMDQMKHFPEVTKRFVREGRSVHCHVEPYEFFALTTGDGVLVGVGQVSAGSLEELVGSATN